MKIHVLDNLKKTKLVLLDNLKKTKTILSDENKWTQKVVARNVDGESVSFMSKNAVCWCLSGALCSVYIRYPSTSKVVVAFRYLERFTEHQEIFDYNDSPTTKYNDILMLLDTGISSLERDLNYEKNRRKKS